MIERNPCLANLAGTYLFPEIARRKNEYLSANPNAKIISLGIGNTTEPLTPHIAKAMADYALALGTPQGYSGYGDEQGMSQLRQKIASEFYGGLVFADEVFVSDGAKCDIARIQTLFGRGVNVAVQDPSYPVYVDGSVIAGAAGAGESAAGGATNATNAAGTNATNAAGGASNGADTNAANGTNGALNTAGGASNAAGTNAAGYAGITYMPCTPENDFFPDLSAVKKNSLIYFCSPNNPTGKASTKSELTRLVEFALKNECIIIFDAAYSEFIRDENLPKTIFQIEGARRCAIEVQSLSKPAGFTGVRLGWSVVPKELSFADGSSVNKDWNRIMTTLFNGACNIAQAGALAALSEQGKKEMRGVIDYYLENARLIEKVARSWKGAQVFFTGNSPYLWVRFAGQKSWQIFDKFLSECQIVVTPGAGFGPAGEGFVRISAFGHRADVEEACERLRNRW